MYNEGSAMEFNMDDIKHQTTLQMGSLIDEDDGIDTMKFTI